MLATFFSATSLKINQTTFQEDKNPPKLKDCQIFNVTIKGFFSIF